MSRIDRFRILGVRVDATQIPEVVQHLESWIAGRNSCRYVAVTGMHGIIEARHNSIFKRVLDSADLVVPDGMPLVWIGRLKGFHMPRRVYGPELMLTFCRQTARKGYRHFFYGGAPGVPEKLAEMLQREFDGLQVAGVYSPPFRTLSLEEDAQIVRMIEKAKPDIIWVGLSTPKQERWMYAHRDELNVPVMIGVGAAFDFYSGTKKQAPSWLRDNGLEWLFRLVYEPRRLWKRYLVYGSEFVVCVGLELLRLKKFH